MQLQKFSKPDVSNFQKSGQIHGQIDLKNQISKKKFLVDVFLEVANSSLSAVTV